jgi:cytochrome c-type biogenesis protein CcmE
MKEHRKKRLIRALSIVLVSALGVGTILYALNSNLDYFFTPSEMLMNDESKNISSSRRVKLGGMVKENSFSINGSIISFEITDFKETMLVMKDSFLTYLRRARELWSSEKCIMKCFMLRKFLQNMMKIICHQT